MKLLKELSIINDNLKLKLENGLWFLETEKDYYFNKDLYLLLKDAHNAEVF